MNSARLAAGSGATLLATGIAIGALGTHALKAPLGPEHYATLQTAVLYQLIDAVGLLALGALARELRWSVRLVLAGTLVFSGSLYLLLAGAPRLIGVLTPLGGACLIVGWSLAACSLWRQR